MSNPWEKYKNIEKTDAMPWDKYKPKREPFNIKPTTYYGKEAIKQVEKKQGRPLTLAERRVVEEEGFVDGVYKDDKGIKTSGVGQTGKYMNMTFDETFQEHLKESKRMISNYDDLPEYLQAEIVQATYRGDIQQSPTARKYIMNKDFEKAAVEILNHKEYKDRKAKGDDGVTRRLEALSKALERYSKEVNP